VSVAPSDRNRSGGKGHGGDVVWLESHLLAVFEDTQVIACRCFDRRDKEKKNGKGKDQRQAPEPTLSWRRHYDDGIYVGFPSKGPNAVEIAVRDGKF
jgi:hypothetical protein